MLNRRTLAEPNMKERFASFGYDSFPAMREQFYAFIASESAKDADVVEKAKASLD